MDSVDSDIENSFEEVLPQLRSQYKKLTDLINNIEVGNTREEWKNNITSELLQLLMDMEFQLQQKRTSLVDEITETMNETRQIAIQLHLPSLPTLNESIKPLRKMLEEAKSEYKRLHDQREKYIQQITAAEKIERNICNQLCKSPKALWNEANQFPSETEVDNFKFYVETLKEELLEKQEEFITLKSHIQTNAKLLKFSPTLNFHTDVLYGEEKTFKLSDTNMINLRKFHQDLEEKKELLIHQIQDLRSKLQSLWELLEVNPHERSIFLEHYTDNDMETLLALKQEVAKYGEQKRMNIVKFLTKLKHELTQIWDLCLMNEQQRSTFLYYNSDNCEEDVLEIHEIEIQKWKDFYRKNQELYTLIDKREKILQKLDTLTKAAQNPDRFKNRGGTLLKEEQDRKAAETSLPKVEKKITEMAELYEEENSQVFRVYGVDIKRIISDRVDQLQKEKQQKLSARKQQQATLTTPSRFNLGTTSCKTPNGTSVRTPRSATSCKKNLLTPFTVQQRSGTRTAPGRVNLTSKVTKQRRISMERGKKLRNAVKRLSTSSRKENERSLMNVTREYSEFVAGSKFIRSTMCQQDEEMPDAISPLAKQLPKSPYGGARAGRSPLKTTNDNKLTAKSRGFDEMF